MSYHITALDLYEIKRSRDEQKHLIFQPNRHISESPFFFEQGDFFDFTVLNPILVFVRIQHIIVLI